MTYPTTPTHPPPPHTQPLPPPPSTPTNSCRTDLLKDPLNSLHSRRLSGYLRDSTRAPQTIARNCQKSHQQSISNSEKRYVSAEPRGTDDSRKAMYMFHRADNVPGESDRKAYCKHFDPSNFKEYQVRTHSEFVLSDYSQSRKHI